MVLYFDYDYELGVYFIIGLKLQVNFLVFKYIICNLQLCNFILI